jgi:hypothetical protein
LSVTPLAAEDTPAESLGPARVDASSDSSDDDDDDDDDDDYEEEDDPRLDYFLMPEPPDLSNGMPPTQHLVYYLNRMPRYVLVGVIIRINRCSNDRMIRM